MGDARPGKQKRCTRTTRAVLRSKQLQRRERESPSRRAVELPWKEGTRVRGDEGVCVAVHLVETDEEEADGGGDWVAAWESIETPMASA